MDVHPAHNRLFNLKTVSSLSGFDAIFAPKVYCLICTKIIFPGTFLVSAILSTLVFLSCFIQLQLSLIFEIFNLLLSDWVSFLSYPNLFGIKGFVVVVVVYSTANLCA
jgi:hypothetical protein